jgi:LysM domain-containing protein
MSRVHPRRRPRSLCRKGGPQGPHIPEVTTDRRTLILAPPAVALAWLLDEPAFAAPARIKGAAMLGAGRIGGAMDTPGLPPRAVWHTTESATGHTAFNAVARYVRRRRVEPHFLYDPTTDRLAQFGPLNQSARALAHDGKTRTNRTGRVCIQVEVLGHARDPFTRHWRPGANFHAMMGAIRSWGVPDRFPIGPPPARGREVDRDVWLHQAGHYGHSNVPGDQDGHWDPGGISPAALFAAASAFRWYTVRSGDSLSVIAYRQGASQSAIARANGLKFPYVVRIGQRLKIPR